MPVPSVAIGEEILASWSNAAKTMLDQAAGKYDARRGLWVVGSGVDEHTEVVAPPASQPAHAIFQGDVPGWRDGLPSLPGDIASAIAAHTQVSDAHHVPPTPGSIDRVIDFTDMLFSGAGGVNRLNLQYRIVRSGQTFNAEQIGVNLPDWITSGEVENWALGAHATTDIPFSKLPSLVRDITDFGYNAGENRLELEFHRNDGGGLATVYAGLPDALQPADIIQVIRDTLVPGDGISLLYTPANQRIHITNALAVDDLTVDFDTSSRDLEVTLGRSQGLDLMATVNIPGGGTSGGGPSDDHIRSLVAGFIDPGDKLATAFVSGADTMDLTTTALDEDEVDDRVTALLPTPTATQARSTSGAAHTTRYGWTPERIRDNVDARVNTINVPPPATDFPINWQNPMNESAAVPGSRQTIAEEFASVWGSINAGTVGNAFARDVLFEHTSDQSAPSQGTLLVITPTRQPASGSDVEMRWTVTDVGVVTQYTLTIPADDWMNAGTQSQNTPHRMTAFVMKRPIRTFSGSNLVGAMWVGRNSSGQFTFRNTHWTTFASYRLRIREVLPGGSGGGGAADGVVSALSLDINAQHEIQVTAPRTIGSTLTASVALSPQSIPDLDAAKTTSGRFDVARLGGGTPTGTKYLRDDGQWITPPGGGGGGADGVLSSLALSLDGQHRIVATGGLTAGGPVVSPGLALTAAAIPDLHASKVTSGLLAAGRIATGTIGPDRFMRSDQQWHIPPGDGVANFLGLALEGGNTLRVTIGRSGSLADLVDTQILPGGGTGTSQDQVSDWVNELLVMGTGLRGEYNDGANTYEIDADVVNDIEATFATNSRNLTIRLPRAQSSDLVAAVNIPGSALDINGLAAISDLSDMDTLPIFDLSEGAIRKVEAQELETHIRIHKGQFDPLLNYAQGSVVETGAVESKLFWIAAEPIPFGQPEPTLVDPHNWWLLATPNHFRQELNQTDTHNFIEGDWFRVGDRVFLATADLVGITGDDLLAGHANVVELTGGDASDPITVPPPADAEDASDTRLYRVTDGNVIQHRVSRPGTVATFTFVLESGGSRYWNPDDRVARFPHGGSVKPSLNSGHQWIAGIGLEAVGDEHRVDLITDGDQPSGQLALRIAVAGGSPQTVVLAPLTNDPNTYRRENVSGLPDAPQLELSIERNGSLRIIHAGEHLVDVVNEETLGEELVPLEGRVAALEEGDTGLTSVEANAPLVGDGTADTPLALSEVPDSLIPSGITRDSEVAAAYVAIGSEAVETITPDLITYTVNGSQVNLDGFGTAAEPVGHIVAFQFRGEFVADATELRISYNGSTPRDVTIYDDTGRRPMTMLDVIRYNYYLLQKANQSWIFIGGTQHTPWTSEETDARINARVDDYVLDGSGLVPVTRGGTGASNATGALANLGAGTAALLDVGIVGEIWQNWAPRGALRRSLFRGCPRGRSLIWEMVPHNRAGHMPTRTS